MRTYLRPACVVWLSLAFGAGCAQLIDVDHEYELGPNPEGDAEPRFDDGGAPVDGAYDAQVDDRDAGDHGGADAATDGGSQPERDAGLDAATPDDGSAEDAASGDDDGGSGRDAGQDAGPDAGNNMEPDAGNNAGQDAGQDAGVDSGANFCARAGSHLVCDDFDDDPPQFWNETSIFGSQRLDSTTFASKPNAFVASTVTLGGSQTAKVTRQRVFAQSNLKGYHFESALRIDGRDQSAQPALGTVEIKNSQTGWYYSTTLVLVGTGAVFEDIFRPTSSAASTHQRRTLPRTIPDKKWVRIAVDVDFSQSGGTVTLRMDGDLMLDKVPLQVNLPEGSEVNLFIGITFVAGPSAPWTVRVDDVVFDLK